jgi:ribosome-binding protein aMBF1 (putative translation factor)
MRRPLFLAACGLLLVLAATFVFRPGPHAPGWLPWYGGEARHSFGHGACGIPIHYVLQEVDPRFGFDQLTAMAAMVEAANLWQSTTSALLFVASDHPEAMSVKLRFDERQQAANTRRSLRSGLDRERRLLAEQEAELLQWSGRIERARGDHDRASAALAQRVREQDAAVLAWNAGRERHSEVRRQALAAESAALRLALGELERIGEELNAEIAAYNRRADELRRRAAEFHAGVARYNQAAGGSSVESGRYSYDRARGRRIEVFRAEDYDELVWILAHELGHALGLGHVEEPGAIMHAMLHDGGGPQPGKMHPEQLAPADLEALFTLCGDRIR